MKAAKSDEYKWKRTNEGNRDNEKNKNNVEENNKTL